MKSDKVKSKKLYTEEDLQKELKEIQDDLGISQDRVEELESSLADAGINDKAWAEAVVNYLTSEKPDSTELIALCAEAGHDEDTLKAQAEFVWCSEGGMLYKKKVV